MSKITVEMEEEEFIEWNKFKNLDKSCDKAVIFSSYYTPYRSIFKQSKSEKYDFINLYKYLIVFGQDSIQKLFKDEMQAKDEVIEGLKEEIKTLESNSEELKKVFVRSYDELVTLYNNNKLWWKDLIIKADINNGVVIMAQNY